MRGVIAGIKNLIYWFPVIWRDHNWDYYHLLQILKHKLQAIEKDAADWMSIDAELLASRLNRAVLMIDMIMEEAHEAEAFEIHKNKWGAAKVEWITLGDNLIEMHVTYPEASDQEAAKEDFRKLLDRANASRKLSIKTLFYIIENNFERWWD